ETTDGRIEVEQVVVAVGPWIATLWEKLGLPDHIDVRQADGSVLENQPMWTYWYLQEGEVLVDPAKFVTADGRSSAVIHLDSDQPLRDDDGLLITDQPWGIYFKPDRSSVQGGAAPIRLGNTFEIDPYPTGTVDSGFARMWSAALSHCLERFVGVSGLYRQARSGGVGAFTVDNFPVFDYIRPNVFVAADSNHGYKMIAVGREIARVVRGEHSTLLAPFAYQRFSTGQLHPVSHSPYPWS
ncbi:MAG: FAD-binding oxidoreductase, partial [Solirubrobacterales bacterium]|nr:FAD-binding oxidoreductase [Solirubrobacterales bacterium]